jgi:hypothetical protein
MSNSDKFKANEKWNLDEIDEDKKTLDDEKISQLKEQINTWKYRTMRAEERVTRLLQLSERRVKNAHDLKQREILSRQSVRGELLPRPGGTRARFSDTLELLTEPLWEELPDPEVEWIVLKVPRGNSSFFLADFVGGDTLDEKEWLEGPFHQTTTVSTLLEFKRQGRSERRHRSRYLRANQGKSVGRVKMTQRVPVGSLQSLQRSIAPLDTELPKLDEKKNPYDKSGGQRESRSEMARSRQRPLMETFYQSVDDVSPAKGESPRIRLRQVGDQNRGGKVVRGRIAKKERPKEE